VPGRLREAEAVSAAAAALGAFGYVSKSRGRGSPLCCQGGGGLGAFGYVCKTRGRGSPLCCQGGGGLLSREKAIAVSLYASGLWRNADHGYGTPPHVAFKLRIMPAKLGLFPYINIKALKILTEKDRPTNIESPKTPILVTICHAGISDTPNLNII
jgi:hypothetical protein